MSVSRLEASYRHCQAVTWHAASNLASCFWLLSADQRRAMEVVYAFARQADDLTDGPNESATTSPVPPWSPGPKAGMAQLRLAIASVDQHLFSPEQLLKETAAAQQGEWPGALALADVGTKLKLSGEHLLDLLRGMEQDLHPIPMATFDDLRQYAYRVAGVVGLLCLQIWQCDDKGAIAGAVDSGLAFQLTNILRDLQEDAQRGRCYLPTSELAHFGVSPEEFLQPQLSPSQIALLQFQIERAKRYFASAKTIAPRIPTQGRRVFALMVARYEAILQAVQQSVQQKTLRPVRFSIPKKLAIAAGTLSGRSLVVPRLLGDAPTPSFLTQSRRVTIVGGGLAGMACAAALVDRGLKVELIEAKRKLGGRASSYEDRSTGERIDHCQHVSMGCCTSLADFCNRTGISGDFSRETVLRFFGPDGKQSRFGSTPLLPAPLHLASSFAGLKYLSWSEKISLTRALGSLIRTGQTPAQRAQEQTLSIGEWLNQHHQSPRLIERFWQVVLVSALGESLDRASIAASRKVFVDGFLANRDAYHVLIPKRPLSDLLDGSVRDWLLKKGVKILSEGSVRQVQLDPTRKRASQIITADGTAQPVDQLVLAVGWWQLASLFSAEQLTQFPRFQQTLDLAQQLVPSPIMGVHLWLDRAAIPLDHAVLVGRLSQWVFARGDMPMGQGTTHGHYYQVVISASHQQNKADRETILTQVMEDLAATWPAVKQAQLLQAKVVKEHTAVFSVSPESDAFRPNQQTSLDNLYLAGDWTFTDWPATMEGAVRSGYLAAQRILSNFGWFDQQVR